MVRFTVGDWDVDFFVARTEYDHVCLSRAREVAVDDTVIRVVTPEDFLIHKLIKLRTDRRRILQDIADLRTMLSAQRTSLDFAYLDEWLPQADRDLLESIAGLDDEAVVRRILGA
jgi:hypothetical protein